MARRKKPIVPLGEAKAGLRVALEFSTPRTRALDAVLEEEREWLVAHPELAEIRRRAEDARLANNEAFMIVQQAWARVKEADPELGEALREAFRDRDSARVKELIT